MVSTTVLVTGLIRLAVTALEIKSVFWKNGGYTRPMFLYDQYV